jgi:hypothetical protein
MVVPRQTKSGAFLARQAAKYAADSAYQLSRMKKLPGLANGITSVLKRNAYIQGEVAKPLDTFLKKSSKAGNALTRAVDTGSAIGKVGGFFAKYGALLSLIAAIGVVQFVNEIQGWRNDQNEKGQESLSRDLSKVLGKLNQYQQRIEANQVAIKEFKQQDQRTRDRIYAVEKQQPKIRDNANDALYEVRQGRKIIDGELARNKANIQELKSQFERILGNAGNNFQKTIEAQNAAFQKALQQAQYQIDRLTNTANKPSQENNEVTKLNNEIKTLNTRLAAAEKITKTVPVAIAKAVEVSQDTAVKAVKAAFAPIQQAQRRWGVSVTPATVTPATITYSEGGIVVPRFATVTPATVTYSDFSTSDIGLQIKVNQEREAETRERQIKAVSGGISATAQATIDARRVADEALREAKIKGVPVNTIEVERRLAETERKITADITGLKTRIGDIDRVNETGNRKIDGLDRKLDQIIPMLGGIPLIPGRVIDGIRPNLLTPPQIEAATGNAICKSLNGGCGKASVDDAVGRINQHNTNNTGSVLDAVNTGANAALLTGQQTILARLGDQLPGGIGGKLTRFSQWLQLDRALNLLTFAATVHNAFQLSNDIAVTLGSALSNVLQLIGIKNDDGSALDIGQIINSTVENLVKGIVGAENYQQMSQAFAKANRIYQASTNVLNSFLNLSQTILQASELIAAYTGRIGNALKKGGVILENAYGWMNPQPKFNRVTKFLEGLQNGASTIQMVTQAPLDVVNATTEFTTAATDFVKAVKEDDKPENKPAPTPEPDELKAKETEGKADSQPLDFDFSDLFDGED